MVELEHVRQDGKEKCGAACLEMIFKHYEVLYEKDEIWNSIKTARPDSYKMYASTQNLVKYSNHCGLDATAYQADANTWPNVLDRLDALNMPTILSVRYRNTTLGHFIVYLGKKNKDYCFNDPDLKKSPIRYDYRQMKEKWSPIGKEVVGFEYIIFEGVAILHRCTHCEHEYPILVRYKVPFSNDVLPFSDRTVCPHCNRVNYGILNLE